MLLEDCFNHKLTSVDDIDDAIWGSSPDQGLWILICHGDDAFDSASTQTERSVVFGNVEAEPKR